MIFSKHIRTIFKTSFVNNFKSFLNLSIDDPDFELSRISKLTRFEAGETNLIHRNFRFVDSESFIYQYSEIFKENLLFFDSKQNNPLIIDCGSNVGVSICYFKMIYPNSKIIAFEPDSQIFSILRHNTKLISSLELHNTAVWTQNTKLSFQPNGADGGKIENNGELSVNAVKLSDFLKVKVNLLKIDIEGAEKFVLPSIAEYLINVENLFLELHLEEKEPELLEQTCFLLRKHGFRFKIDTVGLVNFNSFKDRTSCSMQLNIFAVNENS
ncbi:MAG: hypothetical protein CMC93_00735 [Flavobacteriaceae bacterium]|mgnify:CR=1 FL=1|nr:hypothetical protein [Flavobacteriaceae bacterium]|tara:strand:- start:1438 stop:2244 length:807 start_codon:yes stop_codon:yes gene_type:complete